MEWFEAEDMFNTLFRMKKPFVESVAKDYFRQMVSGLQFLHSLNIVHRDIKCENLLVGHNSDPNKRVLIKYIDFGLAKVVTDGMVDEKAYCLSHLGSNRKINSKMKSIE